MMPKHHVPNNHLAYYSSVLSSEPILNKIEYIKPMASGEPGNRVFSIELYASQKSYKIFVEKEQLISVSEYIIRNLFYNYCKCL